MVGVNLEVEGNFEEEENILEEEIKEEEGDHLEGEESTEEEVIKTNIEEGAEEEAEGAEVEEEIIMIEIIIEEGEEEECEEAASMFQEEAIEAIQIHIATILIEIIKLIYFKNISLSRLFLQSIKSNDKNFIKL